MCIICLWCKRWWPIILIIISYSCFIEIIDL